MKTKLLHASESLTNVVVGYFINIVLVQVFLHSMGYEIAVHENALMGLTIAIVSFGRGYAVRRGFNWYFKRNT